MGMYDIGFIKAVKARNPNVPHSTVGVDINWGLVRRRCGVVGGVVGDVVGGVVVVVGVGSVRAVLRA